MRYWMRSSFSALLALGLAQIALLGGKPRVHPHPARSTIAAVRYHCDAHPVTNDAQTCVSDQIPQRLASTALAPAYPTFEKIPCVNLDASESGCFTVGLDVVRLLPTSRAPPALS